MERGDCGVGVESVLALRGAGAPQLSRVCVLPPTYVSWVGRMQHGVCETLRGLAVRRSARATLALPPHLRLEPRALLEQRALGGLDDGPHPARDAAQLGLGDNERRHGVEHAAKGAQPDAAPHEEGLHRRQVQRSSCMVGERGT